MEIVRLYPKSVGKIRSSVAFGAGLEPGVPRREYWCRTYEMDI